MVFTSPSNINSEFQNPTLKQAIGDKDDQPMDDVKKVEFGHISLQATNSDPCKVDKKICDDQFLVNFGSTLKGSQLVQKYVTTGDILSDVLWIWHNSLGHSFVGVLLCLLMEMMKASPTLLS